MLEQLKEKNFQIKTSHHAGSILEHDMKEAADEIENILINQTLTAEELVQGGGGEAEFTQRLRKSFADSGWGKHNFEIKKSVDDKETESTSHEIDHVKHFDSGTFALEIEWNNKDQFFDRDLSSFERLHAEGIISVGAILTRGKSLQDGFTDIVTQYAKKEGVDSIEKADELHSPTQRQRDMIMNAAESEDSFEVGWAKIFVSEKYGTSTTHWRKLVEKIERGVGSPCPLLLIGIPRDIVKI